MLRMIYEDAEDTVDYPDFDSFAHEKLDDFHLPKHLLCAIEKDEKGLLKLVSYDQLQEMAVGRFDELNPDARRRFFGI